MELPPPPDTAGTGGPAREPDRSGVEAPLLADAEAGPYAHRWSDAQARFVDDPRGAVQDADTLVADLLRALAVRLADHKTELLERWDRGATTDTEQLRRAMQQYRTFFDRLLST